MRFQVSGMFAGIGNNAPVLEELRQQLISNPGVIPFVGAGMCVPCGLPQWSELLRQLAEECGKSETIDALVQIGRFEEAASAIERNFGPALFAERLTKLVGPQAVGCVAGPISLIPSLTRGPVVTTNLDTVLEKVFAEAGFEFPRVGLGPQVDAIRGALHQDQPFLLKIHGGLSDPRTRILTLEDYERAYGSKDAACVSTELSLPLLLEQIFTSRTLLFLGCSLQLDRTLIYMRRVKQNHGAPASHFAVLEDPGGANHRDERARKLAEINIRPIWYPTHRHDLISKLLEEIIEPAFRPSFAPAIRSTEVSNAEVIVGIDLGTSFSAAAYSPDGVAIEYCHTASGSGRVLIPSVVRFLDGLEYTIGDDNDTETSARVIHEVRHFKRELGSARRYRVGRRDYYARDIARLFLRGVRIAIEAKVAMQTPKIVASIPANFSADQVMELREALLSAGFETVRIVGEPCAAALNLCEASNEDATFIVVDVGGGTTDISIVELAYVDDEVQFEILGVGGDNTIGGMDFDTVVCDIVRSQLTQMHPEHGAVLFARHQRTIEEQASALKIALNEQTQATIVIANVELEPGQLDTLTIRIDNDTFQIACIPLLKNLERLIDAVVRDAVGCSLKDLGHNQRKFGKAYSYRFTAVMLAGQGSKLAPIRSFLRQAIDLPVVDRFQEIAVARGLARQASVLAGSLKTQLLLDVIYRGIYFAYVDEMWGERDAEDLQKIQKDWAPIKDGAGGSFVMLMKKNTTVPSKNTVDLLFRSEIDSIAFDVYEADDDPTKPFKPLEKLLIKFREPVRRMQITLHIDANRTMELDFGTTVTESDVPERRVSHLLGTSRASLASWRVDRHLTEL